MHAWEQIQITVDYIEEHISEELKIENLARITSLSQFYFQRLFSRLVKKPINEYIKLRRLAKVSEALLNNDKRNILDIALDFGFSSNETLTRSFKSAFGITPDEYRKNPIRLNNFVKPQLIFNYTVVDENVPLIVDEIVLEISRHKISSLQFFLGLTTEEPFSQIPGGGNTGIDNLGILWEDFHKNKPNIKELKANGHEIGVTYEGTKEGYYRYFAGAESFSNKIADGYTSWTLPEGEYIVCSFEAKNFEQLIMDALYKAHRYLYQTWLPNHKITIKPFSVERYISHNPDTSYMEIWLLPENQK